MLQQFSFAITLVITAVLATVVASTLLVRYVFASNEPTPKSVRRELSMVYFTSSVAAFGSSIIEFVTLPMFVINITKFCWSQRVVLIFAAGFCGVSYLIHYQEEVVLDTMNALLCSGRYIVDYTVITIAYVAGLVSAAVIPIINVFISIIRQATLGTVAILGKCAEITISNTFNDFVQLFLQTIRSFFNFLQEGPSVAVYDVESIVIKAQDLFLFAEKVLTCSCKESGKYIQTALYFLHSSDFPLAIHHGFNMFLSVFQALLRMLPPWSLSTYPSFSEVFVHANATLIHSGLFIDAWLKQGINLVFNIFGGVISVTLPDKFIGSIMAHNLNALSYTAEMALNSTMHLVLPFDRVTDPVHMLKVFSLEKAFTEIISAADILAMVVAWLIRTTIELFASIERVQTGQSFCPGNVGACLTSDCSVKCTEDGIAIVPVPLQCETFDIYSVVSCTALSLFKAALNSIHLLYKFVMDYILSVFVKTILQGESAENIYTGFFSTLRKYEGAWIDRDDLSDTPSSEEYTLQIGVFKQLDRAAKSITSLLQAETFGGIAYNMYRSLIELLRIVARVLANIDKIINLSFWESSINCGYTFSDVTLPCAKNTGALPCASGSVSSDCVCSVTELNSLMTECQCMKQVATLDDSGFTTNSAHWCGIQVFEWLFVFLSRIGEYATTTLNAFNFHGGQFPATPDQCRTDDVYVLDSKTSLTVFGNTCSVNGHHNFVCATASNLEGVVDVIVLTIRNALRNVLSLLSSGSANVDISSEICSVQQELANAGSTVAEMLAFAPEKVRKGIATLMYTFWNTVFGTILELIQLILKFLDAVISGDSSKIGSISESTASIAREGSSKIIMAAVTKLLDIFFEHVLEILDAGATFFDALVAKGGDFFRTMKTVVKLLKDLLTGTLLTVLAGFVSLFFRTIAFFTNPSSLTGTAITQYFKDLFDMIGKVITMMLKQVGKVISAVLKMLGGFGTVIRSVLKFVCYGIKFVTFGAGPNCDAWKDDRRRRLLSVDSETLDLHNSTFEWKGDSFCDRYMRLYPYAENITTPFENLQWFDCLENRVLGEELSRIFMTHPDIMYNWKRKWIMGYHTIITASIYLPWSIQGTGNIQVLRNDLAAAGLDPEAVMTTIHGLKKMLYMATDPKKLHNAIVSVFADADPHYNDPSNKAASAIAYRTYLNISTAAVGIVKALRDPRFGHKLKQVHHAWQKADFSNWTSFAPREMPQILAPEASRAVALLRHGYKHYGIVQTSLACPNDVCFNCAIFDNTIYAAITPMNRSIQFYQNEFPTVVDDFTEYFEGIAEKAYRPLEAGALSEWNFENVTKWDFNLDTNCETADFIFAEGDVFAGFIAGAFIISVGAVINVMLYKFSFMEWLMIAGSANVFYVVIAYSYNFWCVPSIPVRIFHDIANFFSDHLRIGCLCSYIPFLSSSCEVEQCLSCEFLDYSSCYDRLESFKQLSFVWAPIFAVRWLFPWLLKFLYDYNVWPLSYILSLPGIETLTRQASAEEPVTGLQMDCFKTHALDIASVGIVAGLAVVFVAPAVSSVLRALYRLLLALLYSCLSTYYLATSV